MSDARKRFERIVRESKAREELGAGVQGALHPFDERNIHPDIAGVAKKLFDDGYYAHATFEAFKYLDEIVQKLSKVNQTGWKLMMAAFDEANPIIQLTKMSDMSEKDEQKGFRYMFAGSATGIRNPRGHKVNLPDTIDLCLDHLSVASVLLRRLEKREAP